MAQHQQLYLNGRITATVWSAFMLASCVTAKEISYRTESWDCPRIGSDYGVYSALGNGTRNGPHEGIDIDEPIGTPVIAAADGFVTTASFSSCGGNRVILYHGKNENNLHVSSAYAHMSTLSVQTNQNVKRGDLLGTIGKTGDCVGYLPHLHFDIYLRTTNEYTFVPQRGGTNVVWDFKDGSKAMPTSPHNYWYRSLGQLSDKVFIPAYDKSKDYSDQPMGMTYPVACKPVKGTS